MSFADVGILAAGRRRNDTDGVAAALGAGGGGGEDDGRLNSYAVAPTCLFDVHESLSSTSHTGSCCASGARAALPAAPGLRVAGVGDVPVPLSDLHWKVLKSNPSARVVEDESYHRVYSVDSRKAKIKNPAWDKSIKSLVKSVAYNLQARSGPGALVSEIGQAVGIGEGACN